jgi:oligopeptide transport system substrate-binding protein
VPSAAESFETSEDGKTVTFVLRDDLKWTNGDPVVAGDFEYAWKRTVSPELAADYAYQFYGIVGAQEYNSCDAKKDDCAALADKMGVKAVDDKTLEVTLTTPQPWFVQQAAHHSFLAVNKKAVDEFGDKWTEAANIVTNGPFRLENWQHSQAIDLVKWDEWRDAASVKLTRVNGRMIEDGTTAVQAFEAGEVDVNDALPPDEIPRLKETDTYEQYPALGTYYYGFNIKKIADVKQRRAMSLAIDRRSIIDNIAQEDQLPTTGFTPKGMPGFDTINPDSPWQQEFQQYLEFLGPPPNQDVGVYRLGWIGDFVDAINFLELWTCESGNNSTNYCNKEFDALIEEARGTVDNDARYDLYAQAEEILGGEDGDMPVMPIYYYTQTAQERESVKDSWEYNLLTQVDLTKVAVTE